MKKLMFIAFAIVALTSCGTSGTPADAGTTDSTKVCCDTSTCDSAKVECLATDTIKK